MATEISVGLIGLGYIGKVHSIAYRDIPLCFSDSPVKADLRAVLRSGLDTEREAMKSAGFQVATMDPDEFFAQSLDVVDICTPNFLHREHAELAIESGAAVYCEKPLASTLSDARAMAKLADRAGALTQMAYVLRYVPAVRQMKALIDAGAIGDVLNFRGHIFHSGYLDPDRPMSWRLRKRHSGGGAFMDLGAHLVDLVHFLLGDVEAVRAGTRTFIDERVTTPGGGEKEPVDVDDWTLATLELTNGAVGVIEVTRMAAGATEATGFEVYGSEGSVAFRQSQPDYAQFHSLKKGQTIVGPLDLPPIPEERPIDQLWPSGKYSQGYSTNVHMAAVHDLLLNVAEQKPGRLDFQAGVAAQEVIEAVYRSGAAGGERIQLPL